jgi:hypothetical protein
MKLYPIKLYNCTDSNLIDDLKRIREIEQMSKDNEKYYEYYKIMYKALCNAVRRSIEIKNLVGLAFNKDQTEVGVFEFDKEAGIDDFYDILIDENKKFYIEVEN